MIAPGWRKSRLKYLAQINPPLSKTLRMDDDIPVSFLPMEAVGDDGSLDLSRERPLGAVREGYTPFQNGDVIVAKITPCFENGKGALAAALTNGVGFGTTELFVLRPSAGVDARFLNYLVSSDAFRQPATAQMYGAGGQKRVPPSFVQDFEVGLPDVPTQREIAEFLDRETAKIDALIERRRRLHELLDESVHALLSTLIENAGPTRLPLRRVVSRFIDYRGQTPTKTPTGVRLVTARNIKSGQIDYSESEEFIAESDYSDWMVRGLPAVGDLLITTEAPLGEVALIDESSVALAQRIILIKPNTLRVSAAYLWCYFRSVLGRAELEKRATGSTAVGIKASHLRAVPVVVPSAEVQRQIVDTYRAREREVRRIRRSLFKATDLLREQRSALITAAVTGQIDVRHHAARLQ